MLSKSVARAVAQTGQVNIHVSGSELGPPYTYSVGLEKSYGHPELIIFGLDGEPSDYILNKLIEKIKAGKPIPTADGQIHLVTDIGPLPFAVRPAQHSNVIEYVHEARRYYASEQSAANIRYLQIVWPDAAGIFPWEEGFDPHAEGYQTATWA